MKNNFFLLVLIFLSIQSFCQDTLSIATLFPNEYRVDDLGNKYRLIRQDTLVKISVNPTIIEPYLYSNTRLGKITSYNIQNPLKPIINHSELSTLVFTDNTLRETNRLFLPDLEIFSSNIAFAQAFDNSLWLYDDLNAQLIRINEEGRMKSNTLNLVEILNRVPEVLSIQTNREFIILEDEQVGFLVFDQYGGYLKSIRFKEHTNWKLLNDQLIILKDSKLVQYPIEGAQPLN